VVKPSVTSSKDRAVRLAELADRARALGRIAQADRFLLLAWSAYDDVDAVPENVPHTDLAPEPSRRAS
jgi:hypothetical protein